MIKYTKYILILLLLMGYSSNFSKTNAQEPRGNCYSNNQTLSNYTQTACINNSSDAVWDDPSAPRGACLSNGTFYQNWTQIACTHHSNGAVWTSASANFYNFLAPLPVPDPDSNGEMQTTFDPTDPNALGNYLNLIIKLIIGFSAVMAVVMIVMGGLEYMTGELISEKASGKEKITGAVFGLVLVLGSWLLLNEINPDLLNSDITIDTASIKVVLDKSMDVPQTYDPITKKYPDGTTVFGSPWDDSVAKIPTLPYGITAKTPECTTVGQKGCTSIRGLDISVAQKLQWGCKCALIITGGTESWEHGGKTGNTSHMLNSGTVDIRPTEEITKYIMGDEKPKPYEWYQKDGNWYYWEINHWHASGTSKH
jgi:type IV secretory pathway VirB2 component (pilin)